MKIILTLVFAFIFGMSSFAQLPDYKKQETNPNANYFTTVRQWRSFYQEKENTFKRENPGAKELPEELREEIAQFERWAYIWQDKVDANGHFPNAAQGWVNLLKENPNSLNTGSQNSRTQSSVWTSIGPTDSSILNGWAAGAGIGRVNVLIKHPTQNILFAGTAAGGVFKSTDLGSNWSPASDNLAGLGVSDIVLDPTNPNTMYVATGDWDAKHMGSVGVFKSTDGGNTFNATGLVFTLPQSYYIAHLAIDPANPNIIYATGKDYIHRSTDGGVSWTNFYEPAFTNINFNDIVKIGANWYVSDKGGKIYKSNAASTGSDNSFLEIFSVGAEVRLDFAYTPANPDSLYLLKSTNPAFAKLSVVTGLATPFTNITNANPGDNSANFNTQDGYNQVIAVSPTSKDSVWIGEFSGGKLSVNGGQTWQNKLNGYYDPASATTNWGGFYVHSDHHSFTFVGSDTLLIGNDGGAYVGKISTNDYKQKFNGLVATQSYTLAIYDAEPSNLITGNQDNDGSSRVNTGGVSKFYGAQAGDGTATAIGRNDNLNRYLGGTKGALTNRNDGFTTGYAGTDITTPAGAPFLWDLQMHNTNSNIIYGGFATINKMTAAPGGTWVSLNAGNASPIRSISLSNNTATLQKIIVIDQDNNIRKSADEATWTTITKPTGVNFNSLYAKKTNWDTLFATAGGYTAANKIFMSIDNGTTWINITKNFPNILAKKVVLYEGADTIFVATEVGVYASSVVDAVAGLTPWSRFGTGLPNVRVEDMEISYAKHQLYLGTFGRGVWMTDLSNVVLPLNGLDFSFYKTAAEYFLKWKIEDVNNVKTTLEKSIDGATFKAVGQFVTSDKNSQSGFKIANENTAVYYRIFYTKNTGQKVYSHVIMIRPTGSTNLVNIYPNPSKDYVFISSDKKMKTVRLVSIAGVQVTLAQPQSNFYKFDLSLLPKGTYVLQVTDENGQLSQQKVVHN